MQKCAAAFTAFRAVKAALEVKIIIHFKEVSLVSSQRTPTQVHSSFYHIIQDMSNTPEPFVINPGADFTRRRICTFENTILSILTMESHSLKRELFEFYRFQRMPSPTKSAFVQARGKLNTQSLCHLFSCFNQSFPFQKTFKGFHLLGVDGTDSNIPADEDDTDSFIPYNSKNGGYYQNHTVAVYDLLEKRYLDAVIQPRGKLDEQDACVQMVDRNPLEGESLYIMDRGFYGFNLIAHIINQNQFFLIRIKDIQLSSSSFKHIVPPDAEEYSIPVELILSRGRRKEDQQPNKRFLPSNRKFDFIPKGDTKSKYRLAFRLIKIKIGEGKFEFLITNLPDSKFSLADLRSLYNLRWKIETSFLFLKYGIAMNYFHSVCRDFIRQEILAKLILSNYISLMISCVPPIHNNSKFPHAVSVSDAIYKCRLYMLAPMTDTVFLNLLSRDTVPIRHDRTYRRKMQSQVLKSFQNRT